MAQQHTPPAILLLLFFATIAAATTCGGNCPDNSCKSCVCPTTPDIINVTEWCGKYDWDQSCCQCMVTYLSKGNARQQQDQQMNRTGAWLFWNVLTGLVRFTGSFPSAILKFLGLLQRQKVSTAKPRLALIVPTNSTRATGVGASGPQRASTAGATVSEIGH